MKDENEVKNLAVEVIKTLIGQDKLGLDIFSNSRVARTDLERVMREYGKNFVTPPPEIVEYIDVMSVEQDEWSAVIPFWTSEEGRSDLSLELTIKTGSELPIIEIDDCRVL